MKKEVQNSLVILFALVLLSVLLLYTKPILTGNIVYEYQENFYIWGFSNPNNYIYNNSRVSLTQNQANLTQVIEDNSWSEEVTNFSLVTLALKNDSDKTNRVISLDNGDVWIHENDIFDVTFDYELDNNDIINLYLKGNKTSNISLCDKGVQCNMSNYGFLEYPGNEGWYLITIENLQESTNIFGFDVNYKKVEFDYINASYTRAVLHNITNYTYYDSSIETSDLEPAGLSKWEIFKADDNPNNQTISYQYSVNSGNNWFTINHNDNLSHINSNKIKFKINLGTDNTGTPYVYSLNLTYTTAFCTENWNCSEWNECSENNLQTRTCTDLNECGTINNKPNETQTCVYYGNYYEINNNEIISIKKNTLTTINSSSVVLDVLADQDANLTNFTLRKYTNHSNPLSNKINLDKYVDIESNLNLNNAILKIYYTNEEISSLNEDSLKVYHYNETSEQWQELETFVNTGENYVWTNLTHFSTYGVFGDKVSASTPSTSGGSSGGSSPTKKTGDIIIKEEPKEELREIQEQPKETIPEIIEKKEKNIFEILTGQVIERFRNTKDFILDLIILLLISLGILIYKSITFFKRK